MIAPVELAQFSRVRMGAIATVSFNISIGCILGTFGVLMPALEQRLGVGRETSSLGIPAILVAVALTSPIIGALVEKVSLRLLMSLGAVMMTAGYILLALTTNTYIFLLAYLLLIGPSMALNASIVPPILVTRWFDRGRGRALGFMNMPILAIVAAPLIALVLTRYGLSAAYLVLAALGAVLFVVTLGVVDSPAKSGRVDGYTSGTPGGDRISAGAIVRGKGFWLLIGSYEVLMTAASVHSAQLVPIAVGWGIDAPHAATLVSFSSIGAMVGSVAWGWLAERIGGTRTLVLLCLNGGLWWALLLTQPPYMGLAFLSTMLGFSGGPIVPVVSMAVAQVLGQASLGRALGLANLANLPFAVLGVPVVALVYVQSGSYRDAIIGICFFSMLGALCAFSLRARKIKQLEPAPMDKTALSNSDVLLK